MPKLNRDLIRTWLENRDWSIRRLTHEYNTLATTPIPEGTMRNVINGIDPMRPGRIRTICRITALQGDPIPYPQLIETTPDPNNGCRCGCDCC